MLEKRCMQLNPYERKCGPVIYWMSRDQRLQDNWALIKAQQEALAMQQPLMVVFCLSDSFLGATEKHYHWMLKGLQSLAQSLRQKNIPFFVLKGSPADVLPKFALQIQAGCVVTDFSPLRISRNWKNKISQELRIPLIEVDAHNIIPCWIASPKQEFGAYTLRPKINKLLESYLLPFPAVISHPFAFDKAENLSDIPTIDLSVCTYDTALPAGESIALSKMTDFVSRKLPQYALRNDPNMDACSGLSPYLHFGMIASATIAMAVRASDQADHGFLEELIVRKELADNYCYYNPEYDNINGTPKWARETLEAHRADPRPYLYSRTAFENGETHDPVWNAAQIRLNLQGTMHGYLRMYWAKKILEWTASPEEAYDIAIYLNDKYQYDGRDPNGYTGIAWSIGGVHDRAWGERPVFGKIRYMAFDGLKRKFNIQALIHQQNPPNGIQAKI